MRMASVEPLIFGVPIHCGAEGMFAYGPVCRSVLGQRCLQCRVQAVEQVKETWRVALGCGRGLTEHGE